MSSQQVRSNDATASASVASVDMKLEVSSSPSRMSIAQRSSIQGSGGGSTPPAPQVTTFTFFQFTPPGSGSSVQFGVNLTSAAPGSAQGLLLAVSDIEAAREELVARRRRERRVSLCNWDCPQVSRQPRADQQATPRASQLRVVCFVQWSLSARPPSTAPLAPSGRAFDGSRRSIRKSPRSEKENLCSCRE